MPYCVAHDFFMMMLNGYSLKNIRGTFFSSNQADIYIQYIQGQRVGIAASALLMIAVVPPHCLGYCYTTIRYGKIWGGGRE